MTPLPFLLSALMSGGPVASLPASRLRQAEAIGRSLNCGETLARAKQKTKALGTPGYDSGPEDKSLRLVIWYFGDCPRGVLADKACKGALHVTFHDERLHSVMMDVKRSDGWGDETYDRPLLLECDSIKEPTRQPATPSSEDARPGIEPEHE